MTILLWLAACSTDSKPTPNDDDDDNDAIEDIGDDDDDCGTLRCDGDDDDDDSGPTGSPVVIGFAGMGVIDDTDDTAFQAAPYVGTEALYVADWLGPIPATATDLTDANIGPALCEYTWTSVLGTPFSGAVACEDDAGTPCTFAFDMVATGSTETAGTQCAALFEGPLDDADYAYGLHEAFQYEYATYLYDIGGPWLVYYSPTYTEWSPTTNLVTYGNRTLDYNWISQIGFLQPY